MGFHKSGEIVPKKILVIDDEQVVVEVVKAALTKRNYEVFTAGDGKEGLELVKSVHPDLILLDIVMPLMNGYEFMRALKGLKVLEGQPMTPVIVITAKEEMKDLFKFEGAKEYLVKPVESSTLIQKVEELLGPND